jgi:hypothetical protein
MTALVIAACVLVTVGVVAWFAVTRKVPEQAATHGGAHNVAHPEVVVERPAGPDAEDMSPDEFPSN